MATGIRRASLFHLLREKKNCTQDMSQTKARLNIIFKWGSRKGCSVKQILRNGIVKTKQVSPWRREDAFPGKQAGLSHWAEPPATGRDEMIRCVASGPSLFVLL